MSDLAGTITLVTGGTSGIGLSTARAILARGGGVVVNGRRETDAVNDLAKTAQSAGAHFAFAQGDVSKPDVAAAVVAKAAETGRLDHIVHSAGGGVPGTIRDVSAETWMAAFDTHVHSVFHLFRAALPFLEKQGGSMVLLSSVAGIRGCPGAVTYQTIKGALPQLARALARDHAAEGIRVNAVAPGVIRTPFHDQMPEEVRRNNIENRIPLKAEGTPDQVASLILEVMTNSYITGETLTIDGGLTMRIA